MTEAEAFLRATAEAEDDGPRLMYADWLDEHGDPDRADFIRTQCWIERTPRAAPRWRELRSHEAELLRRHASAWLGPWDSPSNEAIFRCGFIDEFRIGGNFAIGLHTPTLSPYHDLTRSFAFYGNAHAERLIPRLGALPRLRRLGCKDCSGGDALVDGLLSWPADRCLTDLVLRGSGVSAAGLEKLAAAPWLGSLRSLDLRDNRPWHGPLMTLLSQPALARLEHLAITGGRELNGPALLALLSDNLVALSSLRVEAGHCEGIRDDGLGLLAHSPVLGRLSKLELISQEIIEYGAVALAASPGARRLRTLSLRNNHLTDNAVAALADSPHLAGLTSLDLGGHLVMHTPYGVAGATRVVRSARLRNLVTLRLTVVGWAGEVAEALLEPGRLPKLRELVLNVPRTDELVARFRARGVEFTTFYGGD
jgi:uncharacterized protein (TIGR02996 family)